MPQTTTAVGVVAVVSLGVRIRQHREDRGWSFEMLAIRATRFSGTKVHKSTIHDIETGSNKRPAFPTVFALAKALDLSASEYYELGELQQNDCSLGQREGVDRGTDDIPEE